MTHSGTLLAYKPTRSPGRSPNSRNPRPASIIRVLVSRYVAHTNGPGSPFICTKKNFTSTGRNKKAKKKIDVTRNRLGASPERRDTVDLRTSCCFACENKG